MRKASMEVPADVIGDFTQKLTELGLENALTGTTDEGEIEVEIYYDKDDSELVDELEEYLEELKEQLNEEEDEEEDEDK
ncbi:MAG: hypothetical protein JST26_05185 [Bacteroidetes bacterium]|nr:hypothetical protein [Bacteroidota bacterium]